MTRYKIENGQEIPDANGDLIKSPVSIDDVVGVLGENYNSNPTFGYYYDLANLCKSNKINFWSNYRPFKMPNIIQQGGSSHVVTEDEKKFVSADNKGNYIQKNSGGEAYGFYQPCVDGQTYTFIFENNQSSGGRIYNSYTGVSIPQLYSANFVNDLSWTLPVDKVDYCRLQDFENYYHSATPAWQKKTARGFYLGSNVDANFIIEFDNQSSLNREYSLDAKWCFAEDSPIGKECYLGIAFQNTNRGDTGVVISTGVRMYDLFFTNVYNMGSGVNIVANDGQINYLSVKFEDTMWVAANESLLWRLVLLHGGWASEAGRVVNQQSGYYDNTYSLELYNEWGRGSITATSQGGGGGDISVVTIDAIVSRGIGDEPAPMHGYYVNNAILMNKVRVVPDISGAFYWHIYRLSNSSQTSATQTFYYNFKVSNTVNVYSEGGEKRFMIVDARIIIDSPAMYMSETLFDGVALDTSTYGAIKPFDGDDVYHSYQSTKTNYEILDSKNHGTYFSSTTNGVNIDQVYYYLYFPGSASSPSSTTTTADFVVKYGVTSLTDSVGSAHNTYDTTAINVIINNTVEP